jgi:hypothetical protein
MGSNFSTTYTDQGFEAEAAKRTIANQNSILRIQQLEAPVMQVRRNAAPTPGMK